MVAPESPRARAGASLEIEVAWVDAAGRVALRALSLPAGARVDDALGALEPSERDALRAGLDSGGLAVAIYGKAQPREAPLRDRDRVELVATLAVDPKLARRRRVQQRRGEGADPRWKRR